MQRLVAVFLMAVMTGCNSKNATDHVAAPSLKEAHWDCGEQPFCPQIKTCAEAKFRLDVCGLGRLDADGDGRPCELTCIGSYTYPGVTPPAAPASTASTVYRSLGPGRVGVYQGGALVRVLGHNAAPTRPGFSGPGGQATLYGDLCTDDCSGHEAGYQWAEENEVIDPDDCGGNSDSFIEGCQAYAEENQ